MVSPSQQSSQRRGRKAGIASLAVLFLMIAASVWVVYNRQFVVDLVTYWQYEPNASVVELADRSDMTDKGRFIFYVSKPSVDGKKTFNKVCERKESGMAVLGCYSKARIYIYDVTDKKLDGIKEVTAAHEMLHAAYERLHSFEREKVDKLIEAEYQKLKSNADYAERVAFYDRTEPGARYNELHSMIGTEIASVSGELEAHYAKYFRDRSVIVDLYDDYSGEFKRLEAEVKALSAQLDALKVKLSTSTDQYEADINQLNTDIRQFNERANRPGGFTTPSAFTAERSTLIARSDAIARSQAEINGIVTKYNEIVEQLNSIVTQSNSLYKSIDSQLTEAPKV